MTHNPRVTRALLRLICVIIGASLAAGTVIAAVAGNPDLSVTLAISLVAFVAGYIMGGG